MPTKRILMVTTGADTWTMKDGHKHPTGFWAEEFVKPHRTFIAAGYEVEFATPRGNKPTLDPLSLSLAYNDHSQAIVDDFVNHVNSIEALNKPQVLLEVDTDRYDAVFVVGGHGPMQDLAVEPAMTIVANKILNNPKKVFSSVCHGPACLLSVFDENGDWLFKGRNLTGFSNEEENQATFAGNAPWLLEDRLRLAGANYQKLDPWTPHVVIDGNLATGQQQASSQVTADAVVKLLSELNG